MNGDSSRSAPARAITRRSVLFTTTAIALSSCASSPKRIIDPQADCLDPVQFRDAHVHFFNGSDLPAGKFARYIVVPQILKIKGALPAIIGELITNVLKGLSPTIQTERRLLRLDRGKADQPRPSMRTAARKIQRYLETREATLYEQARSRGSPENMDCFEYSDPDRGVLMLLQTLRHVRVAGRAANPDGPEKGAAAADVDTGRLAALLRGDRRDADGEIEIKASPLCAPGTEPRISLKLSDIFWLFSWIGMLIDCRSQNVERYRKSMADGNFRCRDAVNLLVDFDFWLREPHGDSHDGPAEGSSHLQQLYFWRDYSKRVSNRIRIRTFAGYDPLKHAYQKKVGEPVWFDRIRDEMAQDSSLVSGFKLYPPLGFRAFENRELRDRDFEGNNGIGESVVRWWKANSMGTPLGEALDEALMEFYRFADEKRLPITLHADPDLLAGDNFSDRPNPVHLEAVLQDMPDLRVCFAHFADAKRFIRRDPTLWAYSVLPTLMTPDRPNLFADFAFSDAFLLASPDEIKSFFLAVLDYCSLYPGMEDRLMFASDWIMLAQVRKHTKYVAKLRRGLQAAIAEKSPGDDHFACFEAKFFDLNFQRFVGRA